MEILRVNNFDFTPYMLRGGLQWTRNDVDSPDAGFMLDGIMRRDRVIIRPTMNVTIANYKFFITDAMIQQMLSAIEPQWVNVTYHDPRIGSTITRRFYSNNINCTLLGVEQGRRRWFLDPFPLIAQGVSGDGRGSFG